MRIKNLRTSAVRCNYAATLGKEYGSFAVEYLGPGRTTKQVYPVVVGVLPLVQSDILKKRIDLVFADGEKSVYESLLQHRPVNKKAVSKKSFTAIVAAITEKQVTRPEPKANPLTEEAKEIKELLANTKPEEHKKVLKGLKNSENLQARAEAGELLQNLEAKEIAESNKAILNSIPIVENKALTPKEEAKAEAKEKPKTKTKPKEEVVETKVANAGSLPPEAEGKRNKSLAKMTKSELTALAVGRGIAITPAMTNKELKEIIETSNK